MVGRAVRALAALCLLAACARTEDSGGVRFVQVFPHGGNESSALIVALHGKGDTPDSFARLWDEFPVAAEIAVPQAFEPLGTGYAWFDWNTPLDDTTLGLKTAAAEVKLWPALLAHANGRQMIVVGFSQGAVLTYAIAARHADRVIAAFPISGRAPRLFWPTTLASAPIHALHGVDDELIPISYARDALKGIHRDFHFMELQEFPGVGHRVSPEMRRALFSQIRTVLKQ